MRTNYKLRAAVICMLLLSCICSFGQSNLRTKNIVLNKDTIALDTLSIIPGTISLKSSSGLALDSSRYKIDYVNALLILNPPFEGNQEGVVSYKIFPFLFSKSYQHKDIRKIQNNQFGEPYVYTYDKTKETDFFKMEGLSKSGSISRGLSFGNNQDVVLNSNLNLQLAGKLSDNMDILLAATDQNIPVQPEGNTQQLQEFDKVFIQIGIKDMPKHGKTTVTAGDFQITKPEGYFMNFNKKLQGLSFEMKHRAVCNDCEFGNLPDTTNGARYADTRITGSMAVSKGKFAKNISLESSNGNTFNGQKQEKNQGAYKLRGAENEQFIIVLAGTEIVYLDGQLLARGQENDYVIDYNTAEITFTPKNLITKDKRITVEFQYSDKNYARSLMHAGFEGNTKKVKLRINGYSEQDNKNRPLQQQLSDAQKLLLYSIGDSLQDALTPSADSVAFNTTEVLYEKKDSANGPFTYPIYLYSTDSAKAHFRVSFSFVGANKGNYVLQQSSANGKVYKWVLPDPITGPQGSYEPVILLITPKQKQMVTAGADFLLSKNSKLALEGAMSNNDINTFSKLGKKNDQGFGGKLNWDWKQPLGQATADTGQAKTNWNLLTNVNYEYLQKTFAPIERFRNVEFERDWNRGTTLQTEDQHIIGGKIGLAKKENLVAYDYKSFLEGSFYNGMRHAANVHVGTSGFLIAGDASYLDSKSSLNNSDFFRHKTSLSKELKFGDSKFKFGVRENSEENLIRQKVADSLIAGSGRFMEWEPFMELRDSSGNKYFLNYKQRTDYALSSLKGAELHRATYAEDYGGGMELLSNANSQFRLTGSYRKLSIVDPSITIQKPENTVIGRTEYNFSMLKGFFTSQTFYEVGSGLELKKEFIYIKVAEGQGIFVWNDYNLNGIEELNEFEQSPFPNDPKAMYIKVWIPTDDYISTFTNQFSEVFGIKPSAKWNNRKGLKKCIARFSNQTAYRTDRKTTNTDLAVAYNPFLSDTKDLTLVTLNSSLRNTIYFNQNDPVFGLDFTWQDVQNKTVLVNDTTYRSNLSKETKGRWNINRKWTLQASYKDGVKKNNSEFFTARNYNIYYYETEPKISFQSSSSMRIMASYKYSQKTNGSPMTMPYEKASAQNFGSEVKYSALNKGSLTAKANFIIVDYNSSENTALAYEMLEGLKTGNNYTWSIGYSRTLASNIQLTLMYDGRQSPGVKIIHTGNAQVRAFF